MHLTLFCTPHPRESRASGEMIDDARRKATRRLRHLKCPPDGRARATRTHSRQPNRRRHARVTPAPADEGHGRAQHDGKEADERTAASVATARVGDRLERLDDMHRHVPPDRCSEAALTIPKDENPEKPWNLEQSP